MAVLWFLIYLLSDPLTHLHKQKKKKMAQYPFRSRRSEGYDNLISSFDTENDLNGITLENLTTPEVDR